MGCVAKVLIVLAQEGYQDIEYAGTRKGLEEAGFEIVLASKEAGECHGSLGGTEQATVALRDVVVADYDRVAFIGGPGAAAYASDGDALRVANETAREQKPLGAICIAPTILAKAHVLSGKKATVWDSGGEQVALLERYGAEYTGERVTVDGLVVTGSGPDAAEECGTTLAAL